MVAPPDSRGGQSERYGPFPDRWWNVLEVVRSVADELDSTPATVALAWLIQVPGVTVIPVIGPRSAAHISAAVDGLRLELTREQWQRISDAGDYRLGSTAYLYS